MTSTNDLWHGYSLADEHLPPPKCTLEADTLARPDCQTGVKGTEYVDTPEVLDRKADKLIEMWTSAQHQLVYAGAGISTGAGIADYASNARGSSVQPRPARLTMPFIRALQPTLAHRAITALERQGLVWGWLQQNHDGLAQKAGFPADKVNELHGCWLDQEKNPIIAMSGSLRDDLFQWLLDMENGCDFVFAVGTSLSGLNADRVAATAGKRHMKKNRGQGLAILSIQKTPYDDVAALRIFSKIDDFMAIVVRKMQLRIDAKTYSYAAPTLPVGPPTETAWMAERASKMEVAAAEAMQRQQQQQPSRRAEAPAAVAAAPRPADTEPTTRPAVPSAIRVGNRHQLTPDGKRHEWTMFVTPESHDVAIKSVTYTLHPTFTPAAVTIAHEQDPHFTLRRIGWGTFEVGVRVDFADGRPSMAVQHDLSFDDSGASQSFQVC